MNYYETLYIIHPALESGRLKDIIMGVEDSLKKLGGKPLAIELWGKRKLSYLIDKQKYGTYILLQYNGVGKCTNDFSVELEHNPNILAYLTTLIDKNDILDQKEDIDVQIAGKTRDVDKLDSSASSATTTDEESKKAINSSEEKVLKEPSIDALDKEETANTEPILKDKDPIEEEASSEIKQPSKEITENKTVNEEEE